MKKIQIISLSITILLPLISLTIVQLVVKNPMLLAERFWQGGGWIEIIVLTIYASWLGQLMIRTKDSGKIRTKYWTFFSFVFFTQLLLGILVSEQFLMTGKLHLPIPALILAGPVFRGEGYFMLILLLSTMAIIGPGWCSHMCYIGAWDNLAALKRRPKKVNRKQTMILRYVIFALVLILALLLRMMGASLVTVFYFALIFGLIGVFLMLYVSRKLGYMYHCTTFCPIGAFVTLVSKLYPVRLKIDQDTCTACNICSPQCRYDALTPIDIKNGKAGWNCTLCGDCLSGCNAGSIHFSFFGMKKNVWEIYISVAVALHAVSLGLARL